MQSLQPVCAAVDRHRGTTGRRSYGWTVDQRRPGAAYWDLPVMYDVATTARTPAADDIKLPGYIC